MSNENYENDPNNTIDDNVNGNDYIDDGEDVGDNVGDNEGDDEGDEDDEGEGDEDDEGDEDEDEGDDEGDEDDEGDDEDDEDDEDDDDEDDEDDEEPNIPDEYISYQQRVINGQRPKMPYDLNEDYTDSLNDRVYNSFTPQVIQNKNAMLYPWNSIEPEFKFKRHQLENYDIASMIRKSDKRVMDNYNKRMIAKNNIINGRDINKVKSFVDVTLRHRKEELEKLRLKTIELASMIKDNQTEEEAKVEEDRAYIIDDEDINNDNENENININNDNENII